MARVKPALFNPRDFMGMITGAVIGGWLINVLAWAFTAYPSHAQSVRVVFATFWLVASVINYGVFLYRSHQRDQAAWLAAQQSDGQVDAS